MLRILPSKDRETVEARYGAQRAEVMDSTYMRLRACPKLLRQGLISPLQMISRELFHIFFLHASLGLGWSPFGSHPKSSMKLPLTWIEWKKVNNPNLPEACRCQPPGEVVYKSEWPCLVDDKIHFCWSQEWFDSVYSLPPFKVWLMLKTLTYIFNIVKCYQ